LGRREKYENPIFQVYSRDDNYIIYYNYHSDQFCGGSYHEDRWKGGMGYYLSIPLELFECSVMDSIQLIFTDYMYLIAIVTVLITAIITSEIYKKSWNKRKLQNEWQLNCLSDMSYEQGIKYVELGKKQFGFQKMCICISVILCILMLILFLVFYNTIFLVLYSGVYIILYLLMKGIKPIRKQKFINSIKNSK